MSKKQFKDTTVGKLLLGATSVINPTLSNVLKGVTSPQEAIAEITKSDAPNVDMIPKVIDHEMVHIDQMKRGDLDYDNDNVYWKGKTPSSIST